jgi:hypothetical protein
MLYNIHFMLYNNDPGVLYNIPRGVIKQVFCNTLLRRGVRWYTRGVIKHDIGVIQHLKWL